MSKLVDEYDTGRFRISYYSRPENPTQFIDNTLDDL
jgi:hypothetical protein